jgi:hypothetical protein
MEFERASFGSAEGSKAVIVNTGRVKYGLSKMSGSEEIRFGGLR